MIKFEHKKGLTIVLRNGKRVAVYGTILHMYLNGLIGCNDAQALDCDDYMVIDASMEYKISSNLEDIMDFIADHYE